MAIVQRNVQIKASPQETMALLSNASRWPDWYPGMTEIDIAAPFPDPRCRRRWYRSSRWSDSSRANLSPKKESEV